MFEDVECVIPNDLQLIFQADGGRQLVAWDAIRRRAALSTSLEGVALLEIGVGMHPA
jgi:hypothetical protein